MIRSGPAASLSRSSLHYVSSSCRRAASNLARPHQLGPEIPRILRPKRPVSLALTPHKPLSTSLQRYAASPFDKIDQKHEEAVENEHLQPHPEQVSATSSVHEVFHEKGVEEEEKDEDMLAGVKADLVGYSILVEKHVY